MIDIHSHILPRLDDGARSLEESVQMCWMGYQDGVRKVVATPHTLNGIYQNDRPIILTKVRELNTILNKINQLNEMEELDPIDIVVLPGADVHFSENIIRQLGEGRAITIGDGGRFLMLEFPSQGIPYRVEDILFQLISRRIIPIISHPERNLEIGNRPKRYYEMIRMGCLGQVTALSLKGGFGSAVKRVAEKLIERRLIHFVASDSHSTDARPPVLSDALKAAERIVGEEGAWKMVNEYPQAVLEGRMPNIPEPRPI